MQYKTVGAAREKVQAILEEFHDRVFYLNDAPGSPPGSAAYCTRWFGPGCTVFGRKAG